jgi:hypothetical protein
VDTRAPPAKDQRWIEVKRHLGELRCGRAGRYDVKRWCVFSAELEADGPSMWARE